MRWQSAISDQYRHDSGEKETVPNSENRIRQLRRPGRWGPGKQWKLSHFFSVDKSKGTARLKGSRLTDTYVLKGFHVHFGCENDRGSEHTRNGRRYSGEVIRCDTLFLSKGEFLLICCFASSLKSHKKLTFWFVQGTRGLSFSPSAQFRSLLKFQYSLAELLFSIQVHFLFEDPSGRYAVVAFWLRINTDHHMI